MSANHEVPGGESPHEDPTIQTQSDLESSLADYDTRRRVLNEEVQRVVESLDREIEVVLGDMFDEERKVRADLDKEVAKIFGELGFSK